MITAGQLPIDLNTKTMPGDVAEQTLQAVSRAGDYSKIWANSKNIVKTTV